MNKTSKPKTLYDKIWDSHVVEKGSNDQPDILYMDLHLIHEVTSPQAFSGLRQRKINVRRPDRTFATVDHAIPTKNTNKPIQDKLAAQMVSAIRKNVKEFGIKFFDMGQKGQGIVHVTGPELGLTQPGMTIVCGDSHTATHGAFGALSFGIGTSEVEMVLATQCLLQKRSKTCEIRIDGNLPKGVTAKDVILAIINKNGIKGGIGYAFEYTGSAIKSMNMEGRMTICNMSIEAGARVGLIAPDKKTFNFLKGKDYFPKGKQWTRSLKKYKHLKTDKSAKYDKKLKVNASKLSPRITYGTNPGMSIAINDKIPNKNSCTSKEEKNQLIKSLNYMRLKQGQKLEGKRVQHVFIGSCTNGRLSDLRSAARLVMGKKIASHVTGWVVPGSFTTKKLAEKEGLDKIFKQAGFQWRQPGCSACLAMNNDKIAPGKYCVSTSNRNFEGRQGKKSRTFLASPIMAAAAAIKGKIIDVRQML